jgi:hypothetical protein
MFGRQCKTSGPEAKMSNPAKENPKMSVKDAIVAYPNEWILMDLADHHLDCLDSSGTILTHDPSRKRVEQAELRFITDWKQKKPDEKHHLYLFDGVMPLRTGDEVREAIRAAIEEGREIGWGLRR